MAGPTEGMSEAELADYYNRTEDVTDFDPSDPEPVTIRRDVTISVRFSGDEIDRLRERAERVGMKVTSYIRAAALGASNPIDRATLAQLAKGLECRARALAEHVGSG